MGSQFEIMVDNHHGSNGNGQHHGSGGTAADDGGNASPTQEMMDLPSDVSVEVSSAAWGRGMVFYPN